MIELVRATRTPWKYLVIQINLARFGLVKRLLTLFLLLLFMLNIVGYYGVFVGISLSDAAAMRQDFDMEKPLQDEVLIKVPIAIPYAVDATDYQRVDGEFEHQGQVFRLVKQKLQSDTLYIVCVKDDSAVKINQALADYVKTFTDKPTTTKSGTVPTFQFSKDYLPITTGVTQTATGWSAPIRYSKDNFNLPTVSRDIQSPPPKAC